MGSFPRSSSISLHYELRGAPDSPQKVLLVMGAFGTRRHFEQLADFLSSSAEVMSYDHRGIGKSVSSAKDRGASQTSELLAADALALLDHVWPNGAAGLHVYGASMGGMVTQKLALLLLARSNSKLPLRTLTLAVTARCYGLARFVPIGASFYRLVLPLALASTPTALVDSLLPKCFSSGFLIEPHPRDSARNMGSQSLTTGGLFATLSPQPHRQRLQDGTTHPPPSLTRSATRTSPSSSLSPSETSSCRRKRNASWQVFCAQPRTARAVGTWGARPSLRRFAESWPHTFALVLLLQVWRGIRKIRHSFNVRTQNDKLPW